MKSFIGYFSTVLILASMAMGFLTPFHHPRCPMIHSAVTSSTLTTSSSSSSSHRRLQMVASPDIEEVYIATTETLQDPLLSSLRIAWVNALQSGELTDMYELMSPVKWTNPVAGSTESDIKDAIKQFSGSGCRTNAESN